MAENKILIFDKEFSFEGLLSVQGFYREARSWLEEHGYSPFEVKHEEQIFEDGKQIFIEMNGEKKLSDYAKVFWISKMTFTNIEDVSVDKDGESVKMNKGKVVCVNMVISKTDWDKTFEQNAFQYFIRLMMDKYIFKSYLSRAEKRAKDDYFTFENKLKSYLNMGTFR